MNELDAILDAARTEVAAGAAPDLDAYAARIRHAAIDTDIADAALARLQRLVAVHRSRATLTREPPAPAAPRRPRPKAYRARPAISANMDVRRRPDSTLEWDAASAVAAWEVRLSERPDARSEYVERETLEVSSTSVELPLGELPLRVHILGRDRRGKLVRRAVISGLTRAGWNDRWQQRPSAS